MVHLIWKDGEDVISVSYGSIPERHKSSYAKGSQKINGCSVEYKCLLCRKIMKAQYLKREGQCA